MKSKLDYKFLYRRRLPHIQPEGATLFVTSRLEGSLPAKVVQKLNQEKEKIDRNLGNILTNQEYERKAVLEYQQLFVKWDDILDRFTTEVRYLSDPRIADLVFESLHYRDGKCMN